MARFLMTLDPHGLVAVGSDIVHWQSWPAPPIG
jgi:hypothetical protein